MSDVDDGPADQPRDTSRFPATLAVTLVAVGVGLLVWSSMLERDNLALLQAHPVLANLLSEAIAFCFGVVILSLVIGRLIAYFGATEKAVGRLSNAILATVLPTKRYRAFLDEVVRHERQILDEVLKNRKVFEELMRRQDAGRRPPPPDIPSQGS
ncbi:hypothetical protein Rhe02_10220 [Rhizocola hellebori]|uniref:Uncharacterized protein n=1 Tax=Rhizocola hellebori TaxID=1392758 RepID=A0A8J3Q335_9ACTN|nr:hypothetical protein [Rhizocola hellebori]GIH02955.1 hypothetical protein Rhe02_10220 [Rhizocola hellebori]